MRKLAALLTLAGALVVGGCNAFGIFGEDDNEVRVTITALAANQVVADDGFTYVTDGSTEYEGANLRGFADLAVGQTVEIEWEAMSGNSRRALEIEAGDHDDKGDDD